MPWRLKERGRRGADGAWSGCLLLESLDLGCAGRVARPAEPLTRGIDAAPAVRDLQRGERNLDDAERAEDHRRVDMAHMGYAERLAGEIADPGPHHQAAMVL